MNAGEVRMAQPAYLTFDDGPDQTATGPVLEALARANAKATFFLLGSRASEQPELVARIRSSGHGVELHGHEHRAHERMTKAEIRRDAELALATLRGLGTRPTRWRPPYGSVTEASAEVAAEFGLELTAWSANPRDWDGASAEALLARLEACLGAHTVIILHDGIEANGAHRADADQTVALIEPLVAALRARGCDPVRLPAGGDGGPPLATSGFRPAPWSRPFAEFRLVEEKAVEPELRRRIGDFIADVYERSGPPYRGRAWRTFPPVARILALADRELIGHAALFFPRTRPSRRIGGLGDLAVAREWRHRGIARTLMRHAVFQGWRRGAEALLVATEAMRSTVLELGFGPVDDFFFFWESATTCSRHRHWLAAEALPLPRPIELLDPDF